MKLGRTLLAIGTLASLVMLPRSEAAERFTFTLIATVNNDTYPAINNSGVVAYTDSTYLAASSSGTLLTTADGFSYFSPFPAINDSDVVAVETVLSNGQGIIVTTTGLRFSVGGGIDISNAGAVYQGGDTVFAYDLSTGATTAIASAQNGFETFYGPSTINDYGQVAFSAAYQLGGGNYIYGVFTGDGTSTRSISDITSLFSMAQYPVVNNAGQVSFNGFLKSGPSGIYVGDGTKLTTVADQSGIFSGFGLSSINNSGWVAFAGTYKTGGSGVYLWDGQNTSKVIGTGDDLFGSPVGNVVHLSTQGLNDSGQITFWAGGRIVRADRVLDADGDGVLDDADACPSSILTPTVVIGGCDSGVPNTLFPSGCSISDDINQCAVGARNHRDFVNCVAEYLNSLRKAGILTNKQKSAIQECARKAGIP